MELMVARVSLWSRYVAIVRLAPVAKSSLASRCRHHQRRGEPRAFNQRPRRAPNNFRGNPDDAIGHTGAAGTRNPLPLAQIDSRSHIVTSYR